MDTNKFPWDVLHDAVFEKLIVTWDEYAKVELIVSPNEIHSIPSESLKIVGTKLKKVTCPQENPWGPSDFVNRVFESEKESTVQLDIEMQSGDIIQIEAESISVHLVEEPES